MIDRHDSDDCCVVTDTVVMMIVPLVCKLCQKAMQAEDSTLPVVAKHLGKLCHGLQGQSRSTASLENAGI